MAAEGEEEAQPEREDSSSSDASDEQDEEPIESLIQGRAKRVTAGNRMSTLVDREADEDLDLLFAENEEDEDVEFEDDDDAGSDAEMDSSTDEEDHGPAKGVDELAGEQELQQQEKSQRKKRKAQDYIKRPSILRKRVKIDESGGTSSTMEGAAMTKPKKKSDRVSWIHSAADTPLRSSSRKQTVINREVVHKRLLDNEKQRAKVMRQMEAAQKRKEERKAKSMTQTERMEEAAKVERKNAKSLNRWEEAEKKRAQEQKAKLEALQNRQLTGPVISWWSGITRWFNDKVSEVGVKAIRAAGHDERSQEESHHQEPQSETVLKPAEKLVGTGENADEKAADTALRAPAQQSDPQDQLDTTMASTDPYAFLDGIHAYAALSPTQEQQHLSQPELGNTARDDLNLGQTSLPEPIQIVEAHLARQPSAPTPSLPLPAPQSEAQIPKMEFSSRNLVALKSIDVNTTKIPELQDSVLLRKKGGKLHKAPTETCAITSQAARFRDPKTGLPYANAYAYGQIQLLKKGGPRWSNLLECYVGSSHVVARGVPERFWKRPS